MNSVASLCRKLNPGQETSPVQTCSLFHYSLDILWLNLMIESILWLNLPYAGCEIQVSQEDKVQWLCSPGTSNIQEPCCWGWNTDLPQWHVLAPLGELKLLKAEEYGGLCDAPRVTSSSYGSQSCCKFHNVCFPQKYPEVLWHFPERLKFTFIFCPVLK